LIGRITFFTNQPLNPVIPIACIEIYCAYFRFIMLELLPEQRIAISKSFLLHRFLRITKRSSEEGGGVKNGNIEFGYQKNIFFFHWAGEHQKKERKISQSLLDFFLFISSFMARKYLKILLLFRRNKIVLEISKC
jgi:hypothetical protein